MSDPHSAFVLICHDDNVLVARRKGETVWRPVGGPLGGSDDGPASCVARHAAELGLIIEGGSYTMAHEDYDRTLEVQLYVYTVTERPNSQRTSNLVELLWIKVEQALQNASDELKKCCRLLQSDRHRDKAPRSHFEYHFVCRLKNFYDPYVILLNSNEQGLHGIVSDKPYEFSVAGLGGPLSFTVEGPGRSKGVHLVDCRQSAGRIVRIVELNQIDMVAYKATLVKGRSVLAHDVPRLPVWAALDSSLTIEIFNFVWLFNTTKPSYRPDGIVGDRQLRVTKLPIEGCHTPPLASYAAPGTVVVVEAPCSSRKSFEIRNWIYYHQHFNPRFSFLSIGVRITHCVDQHKAMTSHKVDGRSRAIRVALYNDMKSHNDRDPSVIAQLQSLLQYEDQCAYDAVILDEFRSLLAYFSHESNSMFRAKDGRRTQLPFLSALERRCKEAKYLIIADADLLMDGAVMAFLERVRPAAKVVHLHVQEKAEAIVRDVEVWYVPDPVQDSGKMKSALMKAVSAVKQDPEQRIFVACGSKKLMGEANRRSSNGKQIPSYYDLFVANGIAPAEILTIHGEVGDEEKMDYFQNLDDRLRVIKVFMCTKAVTVGIDIGVHFGKIFVHTCRTAGVVRDDMQLIPRVGRFEGGLTDKTICMVIHDQAPVKKQAVRQKLATQGKNVTQKITFASALKEVSGVVNCQEGYNKGLAKQNSGVASVPEWWFHVAAYNYMEKSVSRSFHSEEIHRYFQHRGYTIAGVHNEIEGGLGSFGEVEGDWSNKMDPMSRVPAVFNLYQHCSDGDDDDEFLFRLMNNTIDEHEPLSTKQKAIKDVYMKLGLPYKWDLRQEIPLRPGCRCKDEPDIYGYIHLWCATHEKQVKAYTMQAREELLATQIKLDEVTVQDNVGKVDKLRKTDAQRVEGGKAICAILELCSLTDPDGFQLREEFVHIMNQQRANDGICHPTNGQEGRQFARLYAAMRQVCTKIRKPTEYKPRKRGSQFHEDLRTALKVFALRENWPHYKYKNEAFVFVRRVDDKQIKELRNGYGFKPDEGLVQTLCLPRFVRHALTDCEVPLREFKDRVDAADQERFEAQLWEESEVFHDLGVPTFVQPVDGQYIEELSVSALQKLLPHAQRGLHDFNLDRQITGGHYHNQTKRAAMIRVIDQLLAYAESNGATDTIRVPVTYNYKYAQLGRRYAHADVPTLQGMPSGVRKTACEHLYWDLDFEDCYNTILYAVAQHFRFPDNLIDLLKRLTEDKKTTRQNVAQFYQCSEKAAKQLLIKHWMGGRVGKWLKDFEISEDICARVARDGHHPLVVRLEDAAPQVRDLMIAKVPDLEPFLQRVNEERRRAGEEPKTRYTALSYGLQTVEDKLLTKLQDILESRGYTVGSLQYDGLYVFRNGTQGDFPRTVIREIDAELGQVDVGGGLRVPMKLSEKAVKTPYGNLDLPPRTAT